jgi:hypothetical protein
MDYFRQRDIINMNRLSKLSASIIGAGALGSFIALTIGKMGIKKIEVFDEDGVADHNLPNQFYKKSHAEQKSFKVSALEEIVEEFSDTQVKPQFKFYTKEPLQELVIVATDSMSSRKIVWEQFKKQKQCKYYIEVRMGGQLGRMYFIYKKTPENYKFYESTLYSDDKVKPLPCTARSIIYNVLMIASLVGRGVKALINKEKFPRELVFDIGNIYQYSFMIKE